MANDVVPNGIKIEWNYVQNNIPIVNRVYTTKTSTIGSADLDDAIVKATAFYNDIKGLMHPTVILQNITATDVSVANSIQTVLPFTTANVGTGAGSAAAANAAQCISLRTANIGRSFRGRFYLGGCIVNNMADAQNWGTTQTGFLVSHFEAFITALQTVNQTLVVVSRYANKVARVVNLASEVIGVVIDTKVDSQRRRTAN